MMPNEYRQKHKRCSTCEYYDKSCFECKVQKKFICKKEKYRPCSAAMILSGESAAK